MPTQSTTYNTRLTDETLEKRFRDTFRSQGGAELVDDLYASGVIVPVVDFTAAAEGSALRQDLQTAWDFTTQHEEIVNGSVNLVATSGFWQVDLTVSMEVGGGSDFFRLYISDGTTTKTVWRARAVPTSNAAVYTFPDGQLVVFLRPGDTLVGQSGTDDVVANVWYRNIAAASGDLTQPSGFQSS